MHLVVYGYGVGQDQHDLHVHRCRRIPGDARIASGPSLVKPFLDLALLMTLRRVVREEKIDVVCAHNYEALLVALAAGKRPILYHAHNAMSDELPYYFQRKKLAERFGRWLDRTFPHRADCIVTPHRRLAGHLIVRGCDHTKVRIVPPPVDTNLFEPSVAGRETPPVLYAGNLDGYQNIDLLFAAMRTCAAACGSPAGGRDGRQSRFAGRGGDGHARIRFIAARAGPGLRLRRAARILVGYPIKLMNAMAAGKAIVACESAAYPLTHRYNGLIVPDNDARAFGNALLELMQNQKLRAELGKRARETVIKEYEPGRVAVMLDEILQELMPPRKSMRYASPCPAEKAGADSFRTVTRKKTRGFPIAPEQLGGSLNELASPLQEPLPRATSDRVHP